MYVFHKSVNHKSVLMDSKIEVVYAVIYKSEFKKWHFYFS